MTAQTGPFIPAQRAPEESVRPCPYVGLIPFHEKDAAYFFGRERESDLIAANLTASRLTLLYAPSGVGKSSVLQAGVLPRLHRVARETYEDLAIPGAAVAYVSNWSDAPLTHIARQISDAVARVPSAGTVAYAAGADELSVAWLRDVLGQSRVSAIYLIFDQFEEYLLYHPENCDEWGLTSQLGSILSDPGLPVNVLLSIREDAVASLDRFEDQVPGLFDNYLRLTHLSREAAEAAIQGPLDRYNEVVAPDHRMDIDPSLTATLLDQVGTGRMRLTTDEVAPEGFAADRAQADDRGGIETAFLQLVLTHLWDEEERAGSSRLRENTLKRLGGAKKIVQSHLDRVMEALGPAQRDIAAAVFRDLVRPSGAKIALAAQDLVDVAKQPVSVVQGVLDALCAGPRRILRRLPAADETAEHRYEIFHDIIGSAVLDWRRRYVAQQQQAEARATARAARRKLRQTQLIAVAMAVMLILVGALGVLAYRSAREAQQRGLLSQAASTIDNDPVQSLKYAVQAYEIYPNAHAREAVLTAWSKPRSEVVIGRNPKVAGMVFTPDVRRVVAYGERGDLWVIGDNGTIESKARASGLSGTVTRAAVNSDASRIALGTDQGTVAIVDTATGRHIDIETAEGSPMAVQWIGSDANSLVLVTARSGIATIYNPETGKQITRLPGVVYDALPLDDDHMVTSGGDNRLRIWDIKTATKVAESSALASVPRFLKRYKQYIVSLLLGNNPQIIAWDWKAGPDFASNQFWYANGIQQVVVDEQARTRSYTSVIRIADGKEVRTYTPVDGILRGLLPQQEELVNDVAASPDGQWITTAAADGRVLVWFLGPLQQLPTSPTYELLARHGPVSQVGYLHDGKVVVALGVDGTLRRWELPQVPRFDRHTDWVVDMDLSHDGSLLATAGTDHQVFIIDPHDLSRAPAAAFSSDFPLTAVRLDPTEPHRVFTLARGDTPELWYWGGGKAERAQKYSKPPLGVSDYLVSLAVSPDGKTIASGDTQGTIHLWDATTGALRTDRKFEGAGQPANSVVFDSTGQQLAATDSSGIRLWKLAAGDPPKLLAHPYATSVTFDPSGKHLASTAQDRTVRIWTPDGQRDPELIAHGDLVGHPSFSRDGGLLAVGMTNGLVEVWDIHSGVAVMLDRHHDHSVNSVVFTAGDRSHLISSSDDMTVAQFSCPSCIDQDSVIREAVQWAKTN